MIQPVHIIGSYLSPFVRKVLVFLDLKGIPFQIDPIIPFFGDDRFSQVSPLRRVPVLIDDLVSLADSSVICQYLEDRYPTPALYPRHIAQRAQARWLEEFADTRIADVVVQRIFNQVAIAPAVWGDSTNKEVVQAALTQDFPSILDYLESKLPDEGFACGELSVADISIGAMFRNVALSRVPLDDTRWPKTIRYIDRVHALDSFAKLTPIEQRLIRTSPRQHRAVLAELQVPLTPVSYAAEAPRRGLSTR
jgi:glutathione S-transferase